MTAGFGDTPLFAALVAEYTAATEAPPGRHHWVDDPRTEEVPVARHGDDDGDGVANQADPDWLPEPPDPVTPIGPADPDNAAYSRCGDHEPPRWPEPSQDALDALRREADEWADDEWLALVATPIEALDGPHVLVGWEDVPS